MKKTLALLSAAALLLTATTAFASEGKSDVRVKAGLMDRLNLNAHSSADAKIHLGDRLKKMDFENTFMYVGTVKSVSSDSFVMTAKHGFRKDHSDAVQDVTIKTNSDTKIMVLGDGKKSAAFSDIKVGANVWAAGKIEGSINAASWVHIKSQSAQNKKVMGEVTAKSDTSITIKNSVSGQTTTVPVNNDTKVSINGEAKTMTDVQVGDKGMVKLKTVLEVAVAKFVHLFR